MDFGIIVSLLGLLIATANLAVDVVELIIETKREGGSKKPPNQF